MVILVAPLLHCGDRSKEGAPEIGPPTVRPVSQVRRPAQQPSQQISPQMQPKSFTPPTQPVRDRAIGDIAELPVGLRRAFSPSSQFSTIPAPSAGDWLMEHPEPDQSYDRYVASNPNRPDRNRFVIYIIPIGKFHRPLSPSLDTLADYVRRYYQRPVKLLDTVRVDQVDYSQRANADTGQLQLLTGEILKFLASKLPRDGYCLIGVTEIDLYPEPSWNFVFGQASLTQRVGVYSFARYHPSDDAHKTSATTRALVLGRAIKVMAHEIGHMFGMGHCTYFHCVMNGSNSIEESDSQPHHLCPVCLRKLYHAHSFQPVRRYQSLAKFYRKAGLMPQYRWTKTRARAIGGHGK